MRQDIKKRIAFIEKNKVPEGYKMCQVGIVPETWEIAKIGECIEKIEAGVSVVPDGISENDKYKILKTSAVKDGLLDINESKNIKAINEQI